MADVGAIPRTVKIHQNECSQCITSKKKIQHVYSAEELNKCPAETTDSDSTDLPFGLKDRNILDNTTAYNERLLKH